MSQTYAANSFDASFDWDDTLQAFEDNDKCFASSFSGTTAPASPEAGRLWFSTATGHQGLRVRNSANNAWHKVLTGTAATKIWIYANTAVEGWVIDWTVQDKVVAVRSGTDTGAYYASGGTIAGLAWASLDSWFSAIDAHVHAASNHVHQWYNNVDDDEESDQSYNSSGVAQDITTGTTQDKYSRLDRALYALGVGSITQEDEGIEYAEVLGDMYTSSAGAANVAASATLTAPADARPAAALGLVMYPDLT